MSDVQATTPDVGAAAPSQEAAFQSFWDAAQDTERPREETGAQTQQDDAQGVRDAQAAEQGTPKPEGAQEAEEAPSYASLNEMLAAHKIDPESVMGLPVTAKTDGVGPRVRFAGVLKSDQLKCHVKKK